MLPVKIDWAYREVSTLFITDQFDCYLYTGIIVCSYRLREKVLEPRFTNYETYVIT